MVRRDVYQRRDEFRTLPESEASEACGKQMVEGNSEMHDPSCKQSCEMPETHGYLGKRGHPLLQRYEKRW